MSRLGHNVRVLKSSLDMETKLAREYYTEWCAKIKECERLKEDYCQLEKKLECLHQMNDLQDELAHANMNLAAARKSLADYKGRAESLGRYKEKVVDLECKLKDFDTTMSQLDNTKLVSCWNLEYIIMWHVRFVAFVEYEIYGKVIDGKSECNKTPGTGAEQGHY